MIGEFVHPDDQTLIGPFTVEHEPQRKEYKIRATKRRTGGTVLVGFFRYRTNAQLLYLPTQAQAFTLAEIFAFRLNELGITLKDGR